MPQTPEIGPCFECGLPGEYKHHVVPRCLGGTRTIPLCGVCHSKIHDFTESDLTKMRMARGVRGPYRKDIALWKRVEKLNDGVMTNREAEKAIGGVVSRERIRQFWKGEGAAFRWFQEIKAMAAQIMEDNV